MKKKPTRLHANNEINNEIMKRPTMQGILKENKSQMKEANKFT